MPRLFLGTYLSKDSQIALGNICRQNSHLESSWHCRIKWSKQDQLHLTWIFFGNVEEDKINILCQAIEKSIASGQTAGELLIKYEKLECWLSHRKPSLLALVPKNVGTDFSSFANHIRDQLSNYAANDVREQSKKQFRPHITLARLRQNEQLKLLLPANGELATDTLVGLDKIVPLTQTLDSVSLIESKEQDGWHQYRTLKNFSLFNPGNH